jgi:Tol biopolymer transport system component
MGVVGEPGEYGTFRLSPDGRRVAAARDGPGGSDLWLLEVERGIASRFTSNYSAYPVWSPNGRTIMFESLALWRKESSGTEKEEQLTRSTNLQVPTDWSHGGRWALYFEIAPALSGLWVLSVPPTGKPSQETTPRPYIRTPFNDWNGRFSPEAPPRWVAYQADDTGRSEIYIQAFPVPRGPIPISTNGGQYPQWGAGGRDLFYVSLDNKLMAVSLKLGADSVEPATPRELFHLPIVETGQSPYDATPDGQRFLVRATLGQAGEPLTVIVNWPALLKRGAAAQ